MLVVILVAREIRALPETMARTAATALQVQLVIPVLMETAETLV